jgi:hypothetical protein
LTAENLAAMPKIPKKKKKKSKSKRASPAAETDENMGGAEKSNPPGDIACGNAPPPENVEGLQPAERLDWANIPFEDDEIEEGELTRDTDEDLAYELDLRIAAQAAKDLEDAEAEKQTQDVVMQEGEEPAACGGADLTPTNHPLTDLPTAGEPEAIMKSPMGASAIPLEGAQYPPQKEGELPAATTPPEAEFNLATANRELLELLQEEGSKLTAEQVAAMDALYEEQDIKPMIPLNVWNTSWDPDRRMHAARRVLKTLLNANPGDDAAAAVAKQIADRIRGRPLNSSNCSADEGLPPGNSPTPQANR